MSAAAAACPASTPFEKDPMCVAIENGDTDAVFRMIVDGWKFTGNTTSAFEVAAAHSPELAIRILKTGEIPNIDKYMVIIIAVHHPDSILEYLKTEGWTFSENDVAGVINQLRQDPEAKALEILLSRTTEGKRWCPIAYSDIDFEWLATMASKDDGTADVIIDDSNYDDDAAIAQADRRMGREAKGMIKIFIDSAEPEEKSVIDAFLAKHPEFATST